MPAATPPLIQLMSKKLSSLNLKLMSMADPMQLVNGKQQLRAFGLSRVLAKSPLTKKTIQNILVARFCK